MLHEIWESTVIFREASNLHSSKLMGYYFLLKVDLYCRGRSIFDSGRQEYTLHKAVFENNLPLISRLIKCTHDGVFYTEKNELDSGGNTPLILAVKLGNVDAVKVLTDLFTCPKLKSFINCKFRSALTF
jgi:ankyrin repeat protein